MSDRLSRKARGRLIMDNDLIFPPAERDGKAPRIPILASPFSSYSLFCFECSKSSSSRFGIRKLPLPAKWRPIAFRMLGNGPMILPRICQIRAGSGSFYRNHEQSRFRCIEAASHCCSQDQSTTKTAAATGRTSQRETMERLIATSGRC